MMVIERRVGDVYVLNGPVVFHCGCGDTAVIARKKMRAAGVDAPLVISNNNTNTKRYIKQEGLESRIPALRRKKHIVLYNPFSRQYIDLLGAPDTQMVRDNIYKVVNHG